MNKLYLLVTIFITVFFINGFPQQSPLSNANVNDSEKIPTSPSAVITIISPNGGETWQTGTSHTIYWIDDIFERVNVDLYKGNSFHSTIFNSTKSDGHQNWSIPSTLETGSDYSVKITSVNDTSITDISDAEFKILGKQITLTTPNGGEVWQAGMTYNISWTDNINEQVKIDLYKDGLLHSIISSSTNSDGSMNWSIPATMESGSEYIIRITSVDNPSITDISDSEFTIVGEQITVTTPNGGESWQAGTTQIISWSDNIAENVSIELYKGGTLHSTISSSTSSDGSMDWSIPEAMESGSDYRIKITNVNEPSITDTSDAEFTIIEKPITIFSPNGGENWQAGSSQIITWSDNISENVTIELYKGGIFHSVIIASTSSDGVKSWDIPFELESGSDYTVKITSVDDPGIFDFSDSDFTIVGNQITVTSPNGGENWLIDTPNLITWTDNLVDNVELQLYKGGSFYTSISTSTASDGSYTWNIPVETISGSDFKIRITSVINSNIFDESDANFTLSNEIIVTAPNGGESWQAGDSHNIKWTDNITGNVKIELFRGSSFESEITPSTANTGNYTWNIPAETISRSNYKIKISSVDNSSVFDFSDANFEIFSGNITVVSPNGGESWKAGTSQTITWNDNINGNVTIDLYKGGSLHSVISTFTSSDGSKIWDIPFDIETGSDYKVKITSVDDPSITDFSDGNFTIIDNQITVTSPNGGESWLHTEDHVIRWTDNLTGNVEIQLLKNDQFYSSITTSTPSDGEYTWNIPGSTPSASDYKIKIISIDDGNVFDISDDNFTIISNDLTVTSPNGGESWPAGTSQTITWTDDISGNVSIELYKSGVFNSTITSSTSSDGSYLWDIPANITNSSEYKVKITSISQPALFDMSNSNFTIFTADLAVTSPNGNENWQAGTSQIITWIDNITEDVRIELYKGNAVHSIISTSTSSDGSKVWDIPFDIENGSDYKIKITSIDDPAITDFSDNDFTIIDNQITVTSPNGGESWLDTEDHVIRWTDNLTGNVEIQLLKNDQFHSSIKTSTPSDGEYTWNIPGSTPSASDYKIKIISIDDGNVFDISDDNFTIISNDLTVTSPNGGESWPAGTSQTITWTDDISGNVSIELYKSGVFDSTITSSTSSDGSYLWDIPANITNSSEYKVKITSISQPALFDMSNSNFTIFTADLAVTSPNGNENWQAGTSQVITWIDNITEDVRIELYKGGSLHSVIESSTASDGRRNWDIPFTQEAGSDYRIKITSIDDPATTDFSDADFTIISNQITVISPNGGENWLDTKDYIIEWTDNLNGNVEIQLLKNDQFYSSITTSTPSDGEYTWNIPGSAVTASDYKIKIISNENGNIFDISDGNFTIINNIINVTSPNGGENWLIGLSYEIEWSDDISGKVMIELYKAGAIHSTIISSVASISPYLWSIPESIEPGSDYKVKISSINQPALFDTSDSDFSISAGNITITSPNGGQSWMAGSSQTIFWTDNIDGDVIIELYKADTLHSIISGPTASDGVKNWTLPFEIESGNDYKVKIRSVDNSGIYDFSDADFDIEGFEITVISPNGGEIWYVGEDYNIIWTDNLTGNIEIHLLKGGEFLSVIDASDPSDGIKTWSLPSSQETGSDFRIRIASLDNSNIFDISDSTFTIAHKVLVVAPNGGESWQAGSEHTISWSDNITGNVRIELWKTDIFHFLIDPSAPSNGNYNWTIDPTLQADNKYKIKIISVEDTTVNDYSEDNFEIFAGSITIASPNDGEIWQAGELRSIRWIDNINENVQIDLYKGGSLHSNIVASTNSDGNYNWTIPFTLESGSDFSVKITSVNSSNTFDFSNKNFTIVGKEITVTAPNGGESLTKGKTYFITWEDNLSGNIEILLYKGGILHDLVENSTPSDGSYTWQISSNLPSGSDYQIKIASLEESSIFDFSDAEFTISDVVSVENISNEIPEIYTLYQNYPNPFNPRTKIEFGLPEESSVSLKVYDLTGQEVEVVLDNDNLYPGTFRVDFDGSYLPSGIYFYILLAKSNASDLAIRETKKMILMK